MREYFSPDWAELAFGVLVTATWQAAILVAVALAASLCVRRAGARCAVWTACVIGLAAVPVASLVLPHCYLAYRHYAEPLHFPTCIVRPVVGASQEYALWNLSDGGWSDDLCRALVGVWTAGAGVALSRLLWGWVCMLRLLRQSRPCRDPRVQPTVSKVVDRPDAVTVRELDGLVGAICWQLHRAKIILPADTQRLTDLELEMMIRHEWAHLRRSDPGMLFLQRLVEVVYWFHPLVWWVTLQTSKYREFVCDDSVLAAGYRPSEYARCLGQLAVWYYAPLPMAPAGLGMVWSQHLVLMRVKRLLRHVQTSATITRTQRVSICALAALTVLLVGIVRIDWPRVGPAGQVRWTAWPHWSAGLLDALGIQVRDFPLDAHRYDPQGS